MDRVIDLDRVVVVGASCSGKSTVAQALARQLAQPFVDLDELHWGPAWTPKPRDEFERLAADAANQARWVIAGNYGVVRELIWPRATAIVWLDLPFPLVFARAIRRTLQRSLSRELLFSGNRETLGRALFSRESILLWVITSFRRRRAEFAALRTSDRYPGLQWVELRRTSEVRDFVANVESRFTRAQAIARGPAALPAREDRPA